MTYKEWRARNISDARDWLRSNKLSPDLARFLANFIENNHERWSEEYARIEWPQQRKA